MGSVLGSCCGSCIGAAVCSGVCSCLSCKCTSTERCAHRIYVVIVVLAALVGIGLRFGRVDLNIGFEVNLNGLPSVCTGDDCSGLSYQLCNGNNCKGYWGVYRVAFALAGFFLLMAVGTACKSTFASRLHRGYWFGKVGAIVLIFVGCLFAPNDLFAGFAWAARFVGALFLVYQLILLIDFGYSLNATLVEKDEQQHLFCGCSNDGGKIYKILILLMCLLLYGASFGTIGALYGNWPLEDCPFNGAAITTTLLFGLLNTGIAISGIAEHGSLLCSGLIFGYSTWLCYASLSALPDASCNPTFNGRLSGDAPPSAGQIETLVVSCIIMAITVGYLAYRGGNTSGQPSGGTNLMTGQERQELPSSSSAEAEGGRAKAAETRPDEVTVRVEGDEQREDEERVPSDKSWIVYHLKLMSIAMYMSMLLTDWGVPGTQTGVHIQYNVGYATAWLQLSINWLCCLLYLWTLVAVKLCPDRDFS